MPRRSYLHQATQLDLFRPRRPTPEWQQLPAAVRETTTQLIARLLHEYRSQRGTGRAAGGRDDE